MYPYLRLASVLGRAALSGRQSVLTPSVLSLRVMPTDVELALMNNGRYLSLMDFGRFDIAIRCGLAKEIAKNRWTPLVGGVNVSFRRALRLGQTFTLTSRVLCWDEKFHYFDQRFERDGKVHCVGLVRALFASGGKPIPAAELNARVGYRDPSPAVPEYVMRWREAVAAEARAS